MLVLKMLQELNKLFVCCIPMKDIRQVNSWLKLMKDKGNKEVNSICLNVIIYIILIKQELPTPNGWESFGTLLPSWKSFTTHMETCYEAWRSRHMGPTHTWLTKYKEL